MDKTTPESRSKTHNKVRKPRDSTPGLVSMIKYGSLNENDHCEFVCLKTWDLFGGTVWEC